VEGAREIDPPTTDQPWHYYNIGVPIGLPVDHKAKIRSHFKEYFNNGVEANYNVPFGRVVGNFSGTYKATERYHSADVTVEDLPPEAHYDEAFELLKKMFHSAKLHCDYKLHLEDTVVNPKSAIGYHCKRASDILFATGLIKRRWRFKADVYRDCPELTKWMKRWAWWFKIPVLWNTSGKNEILKLKKFLTGDIRTFTYADPFFTLNYSNMLAPVKYFMVLMANDFKHTPGRMGVTFARGSFGEMITELENLICVKGDCWKWDAHYTSVLAYTTARLLAWILGFDKGTKEYEELMYYTEQAFYSFVRMPAGEVFRILKKKSGDPWTTGGNIMGHLLILAAHLVFMASKTGEDPYELFLKCRFNVYADDHLNGYPPHVRQFIQYVFRAKFYKMYGPILHPPPEDQVQDGPDGMMFLGATAKKQFGTYVPTYSFERLLAILQCNDYSHEELAQVLKSIGPLVASNRDAFKVYSQYLNKFFPHLTPILKEDCSVFTGAEGGRRYKNENLRVHFYIPKQDEYKRQQFEFTGGDRYLQRQEAKGGQTATASA
jgi:hypothetical protein